MKFDHNNISPLDNRYANKISEIRKNFSESALIKIRFEIDKNYNIAKEGYFLTIDKNQIKIIARDKAGLFYSFNTLIQLLKDSKDQNVNLPIIEILDYPSLSYRSVHILSLIHI